MPAKNFDNVILDYECTIHGIKIETDKYLHVKAGSGSAIVKIHILSTRTRTGYLKIRLTNAAGVNYSANDGIIARNLTRHMISSEHIGQLKFLLTNREFQILDSVEENPYGAILTTNHGREPIYRPYERNLSVNVNIMPLLDNTIEI